MADRSFSSTPIVSRSVQLAQATTVPWGQVGMSGETARGLGLSNPRGVAPSVPQEGTPRIARIVRWLSIGLTIADALRAIAGPAPVRWTEIALGDAGDLAVRIYGTSYPGPQAGTAVFVRGVGGASLGVVGTIANDGLHFDAGALGRAYGKPLPRVLAGAMPAGGIGAAGPTIAERRDSSVHPNLSTIAARARGLVAAQARYQNWQAHHLIPFAEVQALPVPVQIAVARSGWKMDSVENLVVLPADELTYETAPNFRTLPFHRGPHPNYNREVANRLNHLRQAAASMSAGDIREELREIEASMFQQLLNRRRGFHPRITLNDIAKTRAFG